MVGIFFFGMGFLVFAPMSAFITSLRLWAIPDTEEQRRPRWHGIMAAFIFLTVLELPASITLLGIQWAADDDPKTQRQGVTLLRYLGDETLLLKRSYSVNRMPGGPATLFIVMNTEPVFTDKVREIYYRVTGKAYNQQPNPFDKKHRIRFSERDNDQGGLVVE